MKVVLCFLLLVLCVVVEATTLRIPLTLLILVMVSIFQRKEWVLALALIAGILLDSLTFRFFGSSALFFMIAVGILFLYQKKFETHHMFFGILMTIVLSSCYLLFFEMQHFFLSLVLITILSAITFSAKAYFQFSPKTN